MGKTERSKDIEKPLVKTRRIDVEETLDFPSLGGDILSVIAKFLSKQDFVNLRQVSRRIEEQIRPAFIGTFRFRLNEEVLSSRIASTIQAVHDENGGIFYQRLRESQTRMFLKDVWFEGGIRDWNLILSHENLTHLFLGDTGLKEIPKELGNLTNLKELYLHANKLTQVPPDLGKLVNLEALSLEENELVEIPGELGNLTNLQVLLLDYNQLLRIPREFSKLSKLKELNLASNNLSEIPPDLGRLTNLQRLFLHWNHLSSVPRELGKLTRLERLWLSHNPLQQSRKDLSSFMAQNTEIWL